MSEQDIVDKIKNRFGDKIINISIPMKRRIIIETSPENYKEIIKYILNDLNFQFIEAISGTDMKEYFEILTLIGYGISVGVKCRIPKERAEIDSLYDISPGVDLYEREIHDLLGIVFKGNPNLSKRVILPEDWPDGIHPLKKDYEVKHPEPLR